MSDYGQFELKQITKLEDLANGKVTSLPESDLTIQSDDSIIQMKYKEFDQKRKSVVIKPGVFSFQSTSAGLMLAEFELREYDLLETIDNTKKIKAESDKFFSRLDIYKKRNREPKRAVLLCSPPGVGKTACINKICKELVSQKEGTTIIVWDTSSIKSGSVNDFFLNDSRFESSVKQMILVIEDIGGGTTEDSYSGRGAASSLLNLLDGVGTPFKGIPTFIISTTNNPEKEVGALIDRPGRFDKVIFLETPDVSESEQLLKFISKKDELTEDDKKAAKLAADNKFSIAHLQEIVIRSDLDDTTFLEVAKQLVEHKNKFNKGFAKTKDIGIGFGFNS